VENPAAKALPAQRLRDCNRCVVVCPTGIDIRNGLQTTHQLRPLYRCLRRRDGKLARAPAVLRCAERLRQPKRVMRARLALYAALGALGLIVASIAVSQRTPYEANLLRLRDMLCSWWTAAVFITRSRYTWSTSARHGQL
jgi:polyferredoxin